MSKVASNLPTDTPMNKPPLGPTNMNQSKPPVQQPIQQMTP